MRASWQPHGPGQRIAHWTSAAALDIVRSMRMVNDLLTALGASAKERARTWLRTLLAAHAGCDGIDFD